MSAPAVAWRGSDDPNAPLVVLLHGRGSNENDMVGLADHLSIGRPVAFAAVRGPIPEGGGYGWFASRGIGRPVAESLAATTTWFRGWLDGVAPAGRPVVLVGFSGGAAFAGGLVLADPGRFAGAAVLYGTLPFDVGLPLTPARLAGLPVFVAQGEQDTVVPRDLLDRTWDWLLGESGAPALAGRHPGGHGLAPRAVGDLGQWLRARLDHLAAHGAGPVGPDAQVRWPTLPGAALPPRRGPRPQVGSTIPQEQRGQNAPVALQQRLFERVTALAGVRSGPSAISVPGARGFVLDRDGAGDDAATGPADAFLVPAAGEFAHLHPEHDGSLHLALPPRGRRTWWHRAGEPRTRWPGSGSPRGW